VGVHSVPRESLRFRDISVDGSDRMDNLLKAHSYSSLLQTKIHLAGCR
jgi:hypothetical protein